MKNKALLSIIIVSFNTSQITLDCLKSVFADKGLEFDLNKTNQNEKIPTEIIVIDNDSHDNSVVQLKKVKNIIRQTVLLEKQLKKKIKFILTLGKKQKKLVMSYLAPVSKNIGTSHNIHFKQVFFAVSILNSIYK